MALKIIKIERILGKKADPYREATGPISLGKEKV
jgi:hypothetical protein